MLSSVRAAFLILVAFAAMAIAADRVSAGNYRHDVQEGMCVQVGSVNGGGWSMTSNAPFEGIVTPSTGGYSYGPTIDTDHAGQAPTGANYYYTACNVCPTGTVTVDFAIPDPAIDGGAPRSFQAPGGSTTGCGGGPPGEFDLDLGLLPQVLGGIGFGIAVLVLIVVIALPAPAPPAPVAPLGQPPFDPKPKLVPTDWIQPVAGQAQIMARGDQPFAQTPGIAAGSILTPVPIDAPQQAVLGIHEVGARVTCPAPPGCGQLTLTLFRQGWYCTNLQCPLRAPGTGQTTQFVYRQT